MPKGLLFRDDLDNMTSRGCTVPGCKHEHPDNKTLFLAARCCQEGVSIGQGPGTNTIELYCAKCQKHVVYVAVAGEWRVDRICHSSGPLDVRYTYGSGRLVIECRTCHTPVYELSVPNWMTDGKHQ